MALNGGPHQPFTEAVSFFVRCKDQEEVDRLWTRLTEGGEESQCGWLKDRFGMSWQIIPDRLSELLGDPDPERSQRAMQAMLQMRKIDIQTLEAAANGAGGQRSGSTNLLASFTSASHLRANVEADARRGGRTCVVGSRSSRSWW